MSLGRAVQLSVVQITSGVLMGVAVEAVMPPASSSIAAQVFEAFVQVSLNGVLIAVAAPWLANDDPTHGHAMFLGLVAAQPNLSTRLEALVQTISPLHPQVGPRTEEQL